MAIKQLTVFLQNRKGSIVSVTNVLAQNNINLRALSIAETEEFGILRLIVNDANAAEKILGEQHYLIKTVNVVGVKIGDAPGKLTAALDVLDKADINVEYMYAETFLYEDNMESKSLSEVKKQIESTLISYPNNKLIPAFYIAE